MSTTIFLQHTFCFVRLDRNKETAKVNCISSNNNNRGSSTATAQHLEYRFVQKLQKQKNSKNKIVMVK